MRTTTYKVSAITLIFTLLTGFLVITGSTANAQTALISGVIYRDSNHDGVQQASEPTVENATVTVYVGDNTMVGTTTTTAAGAWAFSVGEPVRVVVEPPTGDDHLVPGPLPAGRTSFIATPGVTNYRSSFAVAADYCPATTADVHTVCFVQNGLDGDTVVGLDWRESEPDGSSAAGSPSVAVPGHNTLATAADTGSVYGVAHHPTSGTTYTAAYLKRHTAYGPGGSNAIYGSRNGTITTYNAGGPSSHSNNLNRDNGALANVSFEGWGDIDISASGTELVGVHMGEQRLYEFPIATDGTLGTPTTLDLPSGDRWWSMGLGIHDNGNAYVGQVDRTNANVRVLRVNDNGTFTTVLQSSALPARQGPCTYNFLDAFCLTNTPGETDSVGGPDGLATLAWGPWDNTYPTLIPELDITQSETGTMFAWNPQPIVADVDWTDDGDMVLGIRDRFGDQSGWEVLSAPSSNDLVFTIAAGDVVVAEADTAAGTYSNLSANFNDAFNNHGDASQGGVATLPGVARIATTRSYPTNVVNSAGVVYYHQNQAQQTEQQRLFEEVGNDPTDGVLTGPTIKGNALGDIDPVCDPAPVWVGDRIWYDIDGDGIQDPSYIDATGTFIQAPEPGMSGLTVELTRNGNVLATTTTDADGYYSFSTEDGMRIGRSYRIKVTSPTGMVVTTKDAGSDDVSDSDAEPLGTGVGARLDFSLTTAGLNVHDYDIGFINADPTAVDLTVVKTIDANGDGTFSDADTASAAETATVDVPFTYQVTVTNNSTVDATNVVVVDTFPTGVTVDGATSPVGTYSAGTWSIPSLAGGASATLDVTARITTADAAGYSAGNLTRENVANITAVDQPDAKTPEGSPVGDTPGYEDPAHVAIVIADPATEIGDRVWEDVNGNGTQDAGEPGIDGVTVELLDDLGNVVSSVTTAGGGAYVFPDLTAGDSYTVNFVPPAGWEFTHRYAGSDTANDSDASPTTGASAEFVLAAAGNYTIDAGLFQPVNVGDFVWEDTNSDGIQDVDEVGVEGVAVTGTMQFGPEALVFSATTDADGGWEFTDVPPGQLMVTFTAPAGYTPAPADQQADDAADSDGPVVNVAVTSGQGVLTIDQGYVPADPAATVSVGDRVWDDSNGNGIQDINEEGLEGATVTLLDSAGIELQTTVTDINGNYLFSGLAPADYILEFTTPTGFVPSPNTAANQETNSDPVPATGRTPVVTLEAGDEVVSIDAGFVPPQPPDVAIVKRVVGAQTVVAGGTVTWAVDVTNSGSSEVLGPITVTDVLPSGLTFVSATSGASSCSHENGTVTCTRDTTLVPAESYNITIVTSLVAASGSTVENVASVTVGPGQTETTLSNNSSGDQVTVAALAVTGSDLTLSLILAALSLMFVGLAADTYYWRKEQIATA